MDRHSQGKGPIVFVESGSSRMRTRRGGRKPTVTPTVKENNIAGNAKNGIEKTWKF